MSCGKSRQVDAYLADQRQEGMASGTSGFTIDQLQAREKLSRYQFDDGGLWLVKMVQAAVTAGASQVKLTFGRRKVAVRFTPAETWDANEIYRALLAEALPHGRALSHLIAGLRAVSSTLAETIRWSVGGHSVTLDRTGTQVAAITAGAEFLLETTRPPRPFPWTKILSAPLEHLLRQTLDDWTAVAQRCWASPIPVLLDGRPLRRGYDAVPEAGMHVGVSRRATSLHRCLAFRTLSSAPGRPLLPYPTETNDQVLIRKGPSYFDTFLSWTPTWIPAQGAVAFHTSQTVAPSVAFVLDGAVVESRLLDPVVQFCREASSLQRPLLAPRFVFPVDPEELDLSGFAVRDIDHLSLFRASQEQCAELVHLLRTHLPDYKARAADEKNLIKNGLDAMEKMLRL